MKMLKMLGVGFVLLFALLFFVAHQQDTNPKAVAGAPEVKLAPIDHALGLCEEWTQKNSKLAVGEFVKEYEITGVKLPSQHHQVGLDYRSKGDGLLMKATCEYVDDGTRPAFLVKAKSAPK